MDEKEIYNDNHLGENQKKNKQGKHGTPILLSPSPSSSSSFFLNNNNDSLPKLKSHSSILKKKLSDLKTKNETVSNEISGNFFTFFFYLHILKFFFFLHFFFFTFI